jgi:hypothetical protein
MKSVIIQFQTRYTCEKHQVTDCCHSVMHGNVDILSVSVVTDGVFQEHLSQKHCFVLYNGRMLPRDNCWLNWCPWYVLSSLFHAADHCLISWNSSPSEVKGICINKCRWPAVRSKFDMYLLTDYNIRQIETKHGDFSKMIFG